MLLKLIVMGLVGAAAPTTGLAGGFAADVVARLAIGDAAGHGPGVELGVVLHSLIDLAGDVGVAAEPATGVGLGGAIHSRIDVAGGAEAAGSPATSD
jgi:hypothetical protein